MQKKHEDVTFDYLLREADYRIPHRIFSCDGVVGLPPERTSHRPRGIQSYMALEEAAAMPFYGLRDGVLGLFLLLGDRRSVVGVIGAVTIAAVLRHTAYFHT